MGAAHGGWPIAALAALLGTAVLATLWGIGLTGWSLVLPALFALAALPGVVLARNLYGRDTGMQWTVAPIWGTTLTSLVMLLLWSAGLRHAAVLLLAPAGALAVAWSVRRWAGLLQAPTFGRRDLVCLLLLLLLVPAIVGLPYARVGADVEDGRAYRAYFTADFVWKMSVVAEVAKGDVPPANQFLRDEPLRYYWLPHLLSAVEYRALSGVIRLDQMLLVNALLFGMAFVAFLYGFTRHFVDPPGWAAAGVALAIACGSYEGIERLLLIWREGVPLVYLKSLNIDAVSRWFYGTLPIDGLHRLLLYQPQHHAAAYAVGFSAILVLVQARRPGHPIVVLLASTCLAACTLLSAFSAIMFTAITVAIAVVLILRSGAGLGDLVTSAVVGAVPLAAAGATALGLAYVDRSAALIEVGPHPLAFTQVWPGLLLNFGLAVPALVVSLPWMAARRHRGAVPLGITVAGCLVFYFFVNVRDVQDVYVGWRAGHLLYVAAAPLIGYALWQCWLVKPLARIVPLGLTAVLALTAVPTTVIDIYNTQDVSNRRAGPGFRWTIVLTPDELEALDWVRHETPSRARVQIEPHVRDPETWAYIPAFGQRRMAAGLPISMVPRTPYEHASIRVQRVFLSQTPEAAFDEAVRHGIDYIFLGGPEREAYPGFEQVLASSPGLFPLAFESRSGEILIYKVSPYTRLGAR